MNPQDPVTNREVPSPSLDLEAAKVYAEYLESRMVDELKVLDSLTHRGVAVITTSGALVTLLLAVGSIVLATDISTASVREWPRTLAGLALIGLVVAASFGLAANDTVPKDPPDLARLRDLDYRSGGPLDAVRWVISQRLATLNDWYPKNTTKARHVRRALFVETVAVGLLAGAIVTAGLGI